LFRCHVSTLIQSQFANMMKTALLMFLSPHNDSNKRMITLG